MKRANAAIDVIAWAVMLGAVALLTNGCADPIGDQARVATVSVAVLSSGGDAIMEARDGALDRVEAAYPADPEHDAQLRIEAARWQPALTALDTARAALVTWIDALDLAHTAGGGSDLLPPLLTLAGRLARLVGEAFALAASLGVEGLPPIPPMLLAIGGE